MTLTTQMPDGARYQIKIAVDDGYLFTVEQRVDQRVAASRSSSARSASSAAPPSRPTRRRWTNHVGPIGVFDGKANYDVNWKDLDEGKTETFDNVSRLARLHRQILADRARARQRRDDRRLPPVARAAATRPTMRWRPVDRRAGPGADDQDPTVRRRQGEGAGSTATRTPASPSSPSRSTGAGSNGSCGRSSTC